MILMPPLLALVVLSGKRARHEQLEYVRDQLVEEKWMAFHANPVGAAVWVVRGAFYAACWLLIVALPAAIRTIPFLGTVAWKTYRYTHSELRATCCIDGGSMNVPSSS